MVRPGLSNEVADQLRTDLENGQRSRNKCHPPEEAGGCLLGQKRARVQPAIEGAGEAPGRRRRRQGPTTVGLVGCKEQTGF